MGRKQKNVQRNRRSKGQEDQERLTRWVQYSKTRIMIDNITKKWKTFDEVPLNPLLNLASLAPWCYPHREDDTQEFRGEHKYKKYIKS